MFVKNHLGIYWILINVEGDGTMSMVKLLKQINYDYFVGKGQIKREVW